MKISSGAGAEHPIFVAGLVALAAVAAGCKGGLDGVFGGNNCPNGVCPFTSIAPPPGGIAQFTVVPTAPVAGLSLTALGSLNPPGHTLPTDHVYMYGWDLSSGVQTTLPPQPVYLPATGALVQLLVSDSVNGRADAKLVFRATQNFFFYLDHVLLTTTMTVGQTYTAGARVGTTQPGSALDLGAFDQSVTHAGFVDTLRYPFQTLHYVSPWEYFAPALQPALYAQLYRAPTAPTRDGKIDYSVAGELVGDWFLQGLPIDSTWQPYGWPRTIAFVYDFFDPSLVRISIGGTVGPAGLFAVDTTAPRPETVTVATGPVAYRLYYYVGTPGQIPQLGLLLVQMTDAATIKVELFPGSTAGTAQFDANAYTYTR